MAFKPQSISVPPPPPRALDVQKFAESRAPELESLHSIITNRLNSDFRTIRSKRRRTTCHDNRITKNRFRKRRKLAGKANEEDDGEKDNLSKVPRRIRRRMELTKNPDSGFCVSGDGTKRLRTHLWHAKRFQMIKRWGFYLPLGLHGRLKYETTYIQYIQSYAIRSRMTAVVKGDNRSIAQNMTERSPARGRGSRAILKKLKSGALIHDASYCRAVQLEGPEESLLKILKLVLVPSPSSFSELPREACHGSAMLHHVGAPDSPLIAPLTYMWRHFSRDHVDIDVEKDPIPNGHRCEESECRMSFLQLWVWLHPAAFDEGFNVLSSACQKQRTEDGVSISCLSLEGHLGKLEIMGSKAVQILKKILHPVFEVSNVSKESLLGKCSTLKDNILSQLEKTSILEHVERLPSHSILSLTVQDPRDISLKGVKDVPTKLSCPKSDQLAKEDSEEGASLMSGDANNKSEVISSIWSNPEVNDFHFSGKSLWTSGDGINPPMEDEALCMLKRQRRLAFFYLDNPNSGSSAITEESASRSCPILLLKNNQIGSCRRWSIILPLSWIKAFWIPLISNGAQAIGLRERRWVSCNDGMPSFPFDFPDCKAYSSFMAAEAIVSDQELDHQPLAMRPVRIPIPPPWGSVRATILEGFVRGGYDQLLDTKTLSTGMAFSRSLVSSDLGDHDGTLIAKDSFQGLIARTSNVLSGYLNETRCRKLLLFPNSTTMGKNCFSKLMDEGRLGWAPKRDIRVPVDPKLCFLRVLLHAYKGGVFEEGAVVCAPVLTDLPLWADRSEEEDRAHIPQHLIESYFTQQQSGKWKLQIPEDPANQQSFRWPIGFVTSGFVRGSTKPAADAFCEATLLARLRAEQWREMQEKGRPDVFVLVRNLRSAAYRVALATIVMEQQQDDLEFM